MSDVVLTGRQFEILWMTAHRSNREIAWELGISHKTVANTLTVVYQKLGVLGRTKFKQLRALEQAGIIGDVDG